MTKRAVRRRVDHRTRVGQERSARTEHRILAAALEVFAERGPEGAVIDDFVQAAGVARGTFYNHFDSVEALLHATSAWTTREALETIEGALAGVDDPAMRFGFGLRLFLAQAARRPLWCRFVARVWKVGGIELPTRDIDEAIRLKRFKAAGVDAARDVLFGGLREGLQRLGEGRGTPGFEGRLVRTCLQALGAAPALVEAVLERPLPASAAAG